MESRQDSWPNDCRANSITGRLPVSTDKRRLWFLAKPLFCKKEKHTKENIVNNSKKGTTSSKGGSCEGCKTKSINSKASEQIRAAFVFIVMY